MNDLLVILDSMGPIGYIFLGLVLILGSRLIRRFTFCPPAPVADACGSGGIAVRVRMRSEKVVPINRNSRVSVPSGYSGRRVVNYF
jgi:hypothetical protein